MSSDSPLPSTSKPAAPGTGKEENREGDTVTMCDVLEEEAALEDDAAAVLGPADHKNCSYMSGGYMTRQALYACLTCTVPRSPDFSPAGICLACSYNCHEGHELVELYTKRKFRCDCGNGRMKGETKCKLEPEKAKENPDNKYNQNFRGVYCICHRPYPDPEDPVPDEMIQCVICEDWFHGRHLGRAEDDCDKDEANTVDRRLVDPDFSIPKDSSYSEMICVGCVKKNPFLSAYAGLAVNVVAKDKDVAASVVDVEGSDDGPSEAKRRKVEDDDDKDEEKNGVSKPEKTTEKKQCPVKTMSAKTRPGTMFMADGWRAELCRCADCGAGVYAGRELEFLLDPEDTVHHYEAKGKEEQGSQYENGMKALSEMDRTQQVEAITSYNSMKSDLMDYLKTFAEEGKVVTQEDIKKFFAAKTKSDGKNRHSTVIPKFCK